MEYMEARMQDWMEAGDKQIEAQHLAELPERLIAHAEQHELLSEFDEHYKWAADLRLAAQIIARLGPRDDENFVDGLKRGWDLGVKGEIAKFAQTLDNYLRETP